MDEPSSDRDNPAKRRRPNDRESDTLFMPRSPEATTPNKDSTVEEALDEYEDDDSSSESDGPQYSESDEFFPNCLAYDPRVEGVKARAELSVQRLDQVLGQYATLNKDLENMKLKTADVMKSRSPTKMRIGFLGGTAAGKFEARILMVHLYMLTTSRQKCIAQLSHRCPRSGEGGSLDLLPDSVEY